MNTPKLTLAKVGSVSHGTCNPDHLVSRLADELEWQISRNSFLSLPENFPLRDRLNALHGEALDAYCDDGETLKDDCDSNELLAELFEALETFAPPYCYFGAHPNDGADYGFWPSMYSIEELPEGDSDASRQGEDCREVNDHGNVTVWSGGKAVLELV